MLRRTFFNPHTRDLSKYFSNTSRQTLSISTIEDPPYKPRSEFETEFRSNHIEINDFQRGLLAVGSAAVSLIDPHRGDMIACLGETTGENALIFMKEQMCRTQEGNDILRDKPRINSKTLDYESLKKLPDDTIGKHYYNFLISNGVTADSRLPVQFIHDVELGYVMQRYREVHDLVHSSLKMRTTMLGEVTIKWVEALQTKLPMCIGGAIFGAVRLKPKHRDLYVKYYLPWALKTGARANFLQGVYFEKRWEQPLYEFYNEMNITEFTMDSRDPENISK